MKTHLYNRFRSVGWIALPATRAWPVARAATTIVVAADGSGDFKSLQEAIMKFPDGRADKPGHHSDQPGTYKEPIYIQREKRFFHLVGEDRGRPC